jgi:uncharacterized protein (DUF362 family)
MRIKDFFYKLIVGVLMGYFPLNGFSSQNDQSAVAELVEVYGSKGHDMVLTAVDALGGICRFVKPGQRVLLKPTMCFAADPDQNRNTHPDFLISVIRLCQEAGAAHVYILDYSIDEWKRVYRMSGLESAAKNSGNKPLPGAGDNFYPLSGICSAIDGQDFRFHRQVKQCDVIINLVKAGIDKEGELMNGVNNLSGILWNRGGETGMAKDEKMLEVFTLYRPSLTLIEATTVVDLSKNKKSKLNCLIASADPVVADACLFELLTWDWPVSDYYFKAKKLQIGEPDPMMVSRQKIYL